MKNVSLGDLMNDPRLRVSLILYSAFVLSVFIYSAMLVSGILSSAELLDESKARIMGIVLAIVSCANIVGRFSIDLFLKPPEVLTSERYYMFLQMRMIVQLALLESVAVFGIVAGISGLPLLPSLGFCAAALFFLLQYFVELKKMAAKYIALRNAEGRPRPA